MTGSVFETKKINASPQIQAGEKPEVEKLWVPIVMCIPVKDNAAFNSFSLMDLTI